MFKRISYDSMVAALLLLLFIIFLCFAAYNQGFCFDASYNILSYQNLFLGKGFIYEYSGITVPFDPVISTGPELYLPAVVLWFLTGGFSFHGVIYVLVAYYFAFFSFFLFYVMRGKRSKTASFMLFAAIFFCRHKLFTDDAAFISPIGEPLCIFFIFAGVYLLIEKRSMLLSFLLIGLGLDVKTNVIVAVFPVLAAVYFLDFFYHAFRERDYKRIIKDFGSFVLGAFLVIGPNAFYTKVLPRIALSGENLEAWKAAVGERKAFMLERGFGHIVEALKNDGLLSKLTSFIAFFKFKVVTAKAFFHGSFTIMVLYAVLLFALLFYSFRRRHFSFYAFLFSSCIYAWWFLGAGDPWYRYWSAADFMFLIGAASLTPLFVSEIKTLPVISVFVLMLYVFLPQFSSKEILRHFNPDSKNQALMMADRISSIDEKQIFTYDWYQAPSLMLLSEKRFNNLLDKKKLIDSINRYGDVFFISTVENSMISEEMKMLESILEPVAEFGHNRLFRIKTDRSLIDDVFTRIDNYRS